MSPYEFFLILFLIAILNYILHKPNFSIPLENNGGIILYPAVFRTEFTLIYEFLTISIYKFLHRFLFRNDEKYLWTRKLNAFFSALMCVLIGIMSWLVSGNFWAGIISCALYSLISPRSHFVPWYINPERISVIFSITAYIMFVLYIKTQGLIWLLPTAFCLILTYSCKISQILESAPIILCLFVFCQDYSIPVLFCLLLLSPVIFCCVVNIKMVKDIIKMVIRHKVGDVQIKRTLHEPELPHSVYMLSDIFTGTALIWIFGFAGLFSLKDSIFSLMLGLWFFSTYLIMMVQRLYSYGHWVPIFPSLSVLSGIGLVVAISPYISNPSSEQFIVIFFTILILLIISLWTSHLHRWNARFFTEHLKEIKKTGEIIKMNTSESDTLFYWGWHPQLYLYASRKNACEPLFFTGVDYLNSTLPTWKKNLAFGFIKNKPKFLIIGLPSFPFEVIDGFLQMKYKQFDKQDGNLSLSSLLELEKCNENLLNLLNEKIKSPEDVVRGGKECVRFYMKEYKYKLCIDMLYGLYSIEPQNNEILDLMNKINNYSWKELTHLGFLDTPSENLLVEKATDGMDVLTVIRQGRKIYLHSALNPREEARNLVQNVNVVDKAIIVIGVGLGYIVNALLEKQISVPIIVLERNGEIFLRAIEKNNFKKNVHFLVSLEPNYAKFVINKILDATHISSQNLVLLQHQASYFLYKDYYDAILMLKR